MTTATKPAPKSKSKNPSTKAKGGKKAAAKKPADATAPKIEKAEKAPKVPKAPKEPKPKRTTAASIVADIAKGDPKLGFAEVVKAAVAKGVNANTARGALVRLKQDKAGA